MACVGSITYIVPFFKCFYIFTCLLQFIYIFLHVSTCFIECFYMCLLVLHFTTFFLHVSTCFDFFYMCYTFPTHLLNVPTFSTCPTFSNMFTCFYIFHIFPYVPTCSTCFHGFLHVSPFSAFFLHVSTCFLHFFILSLHFAAIWFHALRPKEPQTKF